MTDKHIEVDAGTVGSIEALLQQIETFIEQTPLNLGWRIAEQVEAHNNTVVDREYVEWLHVRAFLREVLNGLSAALLTRRDQPDFSKLAKGEIAHSLTLQFGRVLEESEWREVVDAARHLPHVQGLEAKATRRDAPQEPHEEDLAGEATR